MLNRGRWSALVAGDDGSVDLPAMFEGRDGFDSSSHGGGPALVGTARDECVKLAEELLGKSDRDLFGSHTSSVPYWY
jgi:hypothetical protein